MPLTWHMIQKIYLFFDWFHEKFIPKETYLNHTIHQVNPYFSYNTPGHPSIAVLKSEVGQTFAMFLAPNVRALE